MRNIDCIQVPFAFEWFRIFCSLGFCPFVVYYIPCPQFPSTVIENEFVGFHEESLAGVVAYENTGCVVRAIAIYPHCQNTFTSTESYVATCFVVVADEPTSVGRIGIKIVVDCKACVLTVERRVAFNRDRVHFLSETFRRTRSVGSPEFAEIAELSYQSCFKARTVFRKETELKRFSFVAREVFDGLEANQNRNVGIKVFRKIAVENRCFADNRVLDVAYIISFTF